MTYGSFTLHGTGTGKWWVSILCYVLYTLHSDRTGTGNYCFLLYPSRSRVQVPCSVYNPLHIFLSDFLSITNFISVTTKKFDQNTQHYTWFPLFRTYKIPWLYSIFSQGLFSQTITGTVLFFKENVACKQVSKALLALSNYKRWHRN